MKTILSIIISTLLLISSISCVNANEGFLGEMLQINTGTEVFKLENIPSIPTVRFSNPAVAKTHSKFRQVDTVLRNEFIKQYQNGDISYYQMQDLIENYGKFVYYTGKTFEYISENEKHSRSTEVQEAILNSYSNMRIYYIRVQNIIKNK